MRLTSLRLLTLGFVLTIGGLHGAHAQSPAASTPAASNEAVARYAARQLADNYADDGPGATLLVARGDEVLYRGAIGMADMEAKRPLVDGDMLRIGSVTKQFAAAGLLKLVEAGKVGLDDPLSKYLPDYPNGKQISVRQLLNHTSGVKSYTSIPAVMLGGIEKDVTTAGLIDSFKDEVPDFAPGEDWRYNNSGYALVGAVIEAASGKPWYQYLDEVLFKPLGMTDTGYGDDPAIVARQVHGYSRDDGKVVDPKPISMTQPHAAGALVSSVADLHRWNRALHEGKVLQNAGYREMVTPTGAAADARYGFGIFAGKVRGHAALSHGGGIHGFASALDYVPGPDITVAVLQNADGTLEGKDGPSAIARRIVAMVLGDPYPEVKAVPMDVPAMEEYEGVFRVDEETARVLRVVDGRLTGQRTGGPRSVLTPIAKDTFVYDDGFSRFDIVRDDTGKITGMRFFPEGEGEGVFTARSDEPLPAERASVRLTSGQLNRLVGRYTHNAMPLEITLDENTLSARLGNHPVTPLTAESADRFRPTVVDAILEFSPSTGVPTTLTLTQTDSVMEFERVMEERVMDE